MVPRCVQFQQQRAEGGWSEVPFQEGEAFEINNLIQHRVQQSGTIAAHEDAKQLARGQKLPSGCVRFFRER
eukprot:SAG31_NODE_10355_length_1149_cov_1.282857_1_plen_71_part_00